EELREQEREEDRLHRHVGELRRFPPDVHEVPTRQHHRVAQPLESRRAQGGAHALGRGGGWFENVYGSHAASPVSSSASAAWPVRWKNTSSSDGRCSATSSTSMPSRASRSTTRDARPGSSSTATERVR